MNSALQSSPAIDFGYLFSAKTTSIQSLLVFYSKIAVNPAETPPVRTEDKAYVHKTELPINSMQVVHKPDSQLVSIGTAPRMSITSNMMSVSAGGGPCANLQQERTQHTGRLLPGCSRARRINCLHGLTVTPFYPGSRWLGL